MALPAKGFQTELRQLVEPMCLYSVLPQQDEEFIKQKTGISC